jgi:hypothetical protein
MAPPGNKQKQIIGGRALSPVRKSQANQLCSYEGTDTPGQAFGRVARITSSSSLLSAGF